MRKRLKYEFALVLLAQNASLNIQFVPLVLHRESSKLKSWVLRDEELPSRDIFASLSEFQKEVKGFCTQVLVHKKLSRCVFAHF